MGAQAEYAFFILGLAMAPVGLILLGIAAYQRNRRIALYGGICLAIFLLAIARVHYAQFWDVDACLDHGGNFDYEANQCVYE